MSCQASSLEILSDSVDMSDIFSQALENDLRTGFENISNGNLSGHTRICKPCSPD